MNTQLTEISASGDITTTSLKLAELFERTHKSILRTIRGIIKDFTTNEIWRRNIAPPDYKDSRGKVNTDSVESVLIRSGRAKLDGLTCEPMFYKDTTGLLTFEQSDLFV
jgi:hypothetical protein